MQSERVAQRAPGQTLFEVRARQPRARPTAPVQVHAPDQPIRHDLAVYRRAHPVHLPPSFLAPRFSDRPFAPGQIASVQSNSDVTAT